MDHNFFFSLVPFGCVIMLLLLTAIMIKHKIKKSNCSHKNKHIYVENTAATCEITTTTCLDCGKKTTKTEC